MTNIEHEDLVRNHGDNNYLSYRLLNFEVVNQSGIETLNCRKVGFELSLILSPSVNV